MIIPILSTDERDGKNRRVFGPKINETFLTLEGRIISTVFVIYSSQHVTGKQQYRNNVSLTGGITRIIDCLELTNEDFFLRDMIVLLHDILIFEKRKKIL